MKPTQRIIETGFATIILAVFILVLSWYFTINYLSQQLNEIVFHDAQKSQWLSVLRDSARARALSLHRMALMVDPFERDLEYQQFVEHAARFVIARDHYLVEPRSIAEQEQWGQLRSAIIQGEESQEAVADAINAGELMQGRALLLNEVIPIQNRVISRIDTLLADQSHKSEIAVQDADHFIHRTHWAILLFGTTIVLACLGIAWIVTRRSQRDELALIAAAVEARHADEIKSEFLARVSHELRTPLNAIIGYSELLLDEEIIRGHEQTSKDVGNIRASGQHLLSLVNDVLDLSKIEAGKYALTLQHVSLVPLLYQLIGQFQSQAFANTVNITVECDPGISLFTDERALRQVLQNVVSNAFKFTHNGSIRIQVRPASKHCEIHIIDTGIGMTLEEQQRIFHPFVQAHAAIAERYGGTGIGLAFARDLCRILAGTLTVESISGKGSTFTVRLPYKSLS